MGLRDEISYDNLHIIEAEKRSHCCRKQENAIIAVFHVHGGEYAYMALKMPDACVSHAFGQSACTLTSLIVPRSLV